jgi:hypothetical protein
MIKKVLTFLLLMQVGFAMIWIAIRAISKESDKIGSPDIATKEIPELPSMNLTRENMDIVPLFTISPNQPRILTLGGLIKEFEVPVGKNGRGLAFDNTDLYYSLRDSVHKGKIFKVDTDGNLLKTMGPAPWYRMIGALAFDPITGNLWAATYDSTTARFFEIDTTGTGDIVSYFDQPSGGWGPNDPKPTKIDGLAFDPNSSHLWYSTDTGYEVFEVDTTGTLISSFPAPGGRALSGTAFDGINLWHGVATH